LPAAAAATAAAPSLAGTEPDGGWSRDARGHFVPDERVIRLFDYYLSATGEADDAAIRDYVLASARAQLFPADIDGAINLYDRYREYRRALGDAFDGADPRTDARAAAALIERTQAELFGAEAARRMFATANALMVDAIERRDLAARTDLDGDERATRQALLDAQLPAAVRTARARRQALAAEVARATASR
jgi:lipase chaperone LimK